MRLPSALKATSVIRSAGPPSGVPMACRPSMLHTTAERRCALTRVRPSGLNATSLGGLVSARSGAPYGSPDRTSQTKTGPAKDAAASSRPSGLSESAAAGSLPTDHGRRTARPVAISTTDTEPESSLAIRTRPPRAKIASSTSALPTAMGLPMRRPVATSQMPTDPGAPGTAMRFESGLKEIDCAPPPGGLVVIGPATTRPLAASHSVTWFDSWPPAAITVPSGL